MTLAPVVLGHTRWATQGARTLDNASPLNVGDIIGTHNGDVTAPTRNGSTDSAWLFDQLDHAPTIKATAAVLTRLRGRAALAWTRRSRSDLVYLARTALSPLATAIDRAGALWWASNPAMAAGRSTTGTTWNCPTRCRCARAPSSCCTPTATRSAWSPTAGSPRPAAPATNGSPTPRPGVDSPSPTAATNRAVVVGTASAEDLSQPQHPKCLPGRVNHPLVEGPHARRTIRSDDQEHADNGCQARDTPQQIQPHHRLARCWRSRATRARTRRQLSGGGRGRSAAADVRSRMR